MWRAEKMSEDFLLALCYTNPIFSCLIKAIAFPFFCIHSSVLCARRLLGSETSVFVSGKNQLDQ